MSVIGSNFSVVETGSMVKKLVPSHTGRRWQSEELNPGVSNYKFMLLLLSSQFYMQYLS